MSGVKTSETLLGDFRTDTRMLVLAGLAIPLGIISALVARALLWLIAEITNLVFSSALGLNFQLQLIIISVPGSSPRRSLARSLSD